MTSNTRLNGTQVRESTDYSLTREICVTEARDECLTPSSEHDKTVIREAIDIRAEANAKLRKIKYADEVGDAPYLVPEPRNRCRATYVPTFGRTGSSSVVGQKRCAPHRGITVSQSVHSLAPPEQRRPTRKCRGSSFLSARGLRARVRRARPGTGRPLATPAANEP
jgi:hypothetical protein